MIPRVYFVGTAGSGKSTLVNTVKEWMENLSYDAITVNLDPGAEFLPYTPDIDIRENISLESVMENYSLGPNGAQIVAADLVVQEAERIKELMDSYDSDYTLIDTPGQLELFAFRGSSSQLISTLGEENNAMLYLFDAVLMKNPESYVSSRFLAMSVMTRFYVPFLGVVSKTDLLEPEERMRIERWDRNRNELIKDLRESSASLNVQLSEAILNGSESLSILGESIFTSSESEEGVEDIYAFLQKIFYGSDDLEKR
ncbi:MAG: ATP/GTP-binding protein [Candidatus Thermoplasmatota archaeon]|jgi:GTPase SAR1 family protein|nr:ATP/GTP-binding protein [Candidatus Thermoplasmatota archaeon]MCL5874137.1 ATP/GTP-binding protein [Candidatus Thermoplasmatota archaeon]